MMSMKEKGFIMAQKGKRSTPEEAAAGAQNLAKWLSDHPERGRISHGAHSAHIKKRYGNRNFKEGKHLYAVMKSLVDDLGGPEAISASQKLLLDSIKSKLIVLLCISQYIEKQDSLISASGELLPCLGRNFTTYSESLRRDLEALAALAGKKGKVDLNEYLAGAYGKGSK